MRPFDGQLYKVGSAEDDEQVNLAQKALNITVEEHDGDPERYLREFNLYKVTLPSSSIQRTTY